MESMRTAAMRHDNGAVLPGRYELPNGRKMPITVVAVTHTLELLSSFTHVIYVVNSTVAEYGTKDELYKRKGHYFRRISANSGLSINSRGNAAIDVHRYLLIRSRTP